MHFSGTLTEEVWLGVDRGILLPPAIGGALIRARANLTTTLIAGGLVAALGVAVYTAAPASATTAKKQACTLAGTSGPDTLKGISGRDVICGLGGDDVLLGRGGDDVIRGGPGADRVLGGPGDDDLNGGPGRDVVNGEEGRDELAGGPGKDQVIQDLSTKEIPTAVTLDWRMTVPDGFTGGPLLQPLHDSEVDPRNQHHRHLEYQDATAVSGSS